MFTFFMDSLGARFAPVTLVHARVGAYVHETLRFQGPFREARALPSPRFHGP